MTDNRSAAEGTIRDPGPNEPQGESITPRLSLSVLNTSHERFRIIKTYGHGGLGVVSIAHDVELDRMVAIKEMRLGRPSDDDVQRFLLEARLTGQLDHPGIPPVYAIGYFEDGRPFYAMRLVEGVTLRSAIKDFHAKFPHPDVSRQRSMQLRQLIGAIVSVCNTLRFAHSRGVLHRDIKPSNIMLGEYGETLLMDWGLAKSQKQSLPYSDFEAKAHQNRRKLEDPEDTGTGSVFGTPHYMSPEQACGDVESINQRSEVYSMGATLYSVLTGKPPYTGETRDEVLAKVRKGDFIPPRQVDSRVPPELNAICVKAMALERGDRYADPGELATDIEHWLADETVSCYREPPSRRWQRWVKAHQVWVAGASVLMATCFIGLLVGTYFVSVKHSEAIAAHEEADKAKQMATTITEQSRELLSRSFVYTFNRRMREIPGTEQTRLDVLELFIKQFEDWSSGPTASDRDRHELAKALYERALIRMDLNQIDWAWADMQSALTMLESLLHTTDRQVLNPCQLDRIHLLVNMSKTLEDFDLGNASPEPLIQQIHLWTVHQFQMNSESIAYQIDLAEATMQLGIAKYQRGQYTEAFELLSRATCIFQNLASTELASDVAEQLFEGEQVINLRVLQSRAELMKAVVALGDQERASEIASETYAMLDKACRHSPSDLNLWILKSELLLENSNLSKSELDSLANRLSKELAFRPNHKRLQLLQLKIFVNRGVQDLYAGDLLSARSQCELALIASEKLKQDQVRTSIYQALQERATSMLSLIRQMNGDFESEYQCLEEQEFSVSNNLSSDTN